MYTVFNKTYQPIFLIGGEVVEPRKSIKVNELSQQIKNLEKREFLLVKKDK